MGAEKTIGHLTVRLGGDSKGFRKEMSRSKKGLNSFSKQLSSMKGLIAGVFAVGAIKSFLTSSTRAFDVQAKSEASLLTALKGRISVQQRLIGQAQSLQGITLFGDEETINAQALIGAFVEEEAHIKKIIPLVQDLATAKKMDLAGAADLVSKTLGSSTNALARYGIEVKGAVGSVERLESLAEGLSSKFLGQAEAAAKAGTGGLTQLSNIWGDMKESAGALIYSGIAPLTRSLIKSLAPVNSVSDSLIKQQASVNQLVGAITSLNMEDKARASLLTELNTKYPDLLGNMDAEKVSNEDLIKLKTEYNGLIRERIKLAVYEEELTKLEQDGQQLFKKELTLIKTVDAAYQKYITNKKENATVQEKLNDLQTEGAISLDVISSEWAHLDDVTGSVSMQSIMQSVITGAIDKSRQYKNLLEDQIQIEQEIIAITGKKGEIQKEVDALTIDGGKKVDENLIKQIPLLKAANDKLTDLKTARSAALTTEHLAKYNKLIAYQQAEIKNLEKLGTIRKPSGIKTMPMLGPTTIKDPTINTPGVLSQISVTKLALEDYSLVAVNVSQVVGDSMANMGMSIGKTFADILTGQATIGDFFKGILVAVADFMGQFGIQLILASKAAIAFKALLIAPWAGLAAGFALVTASAIIKGLLSKGPTQKSSGTPRLAKGGLAFGPTLAMVGDNMGASSNPEVIAPLDKLQSMMGFGNMKIEVTGVLKSSGNELLGIIESAIVTKQRITG